MADRPTESSADKTGISSNFYEKLSQTNDVTESAQDSTSQFSRKDRKKLKKLKKRAALVLTESERSGLLTRAEYEEYQALVRLEDQDRLHRTQVDDRKSYDVGDAESSGLSKASPLLSVHPSINVRKKCFGVQKVEGATHRDLLSWLLKQKFHGTQHQQSRKRRLDDGNPKDGNVEVSIPHWASVHNPGTCEQVAVLEIHLPNDKMDPYRQFLESCKRNNESSPNKSNETFDEVSADSQCSRSHIGFLTKWFQGYIPKSMSESLLYFSNAKEHKNRKIGDETKFPSASDFVRRLEAMVLSPEEMNEQGYPSVLSSSAQDKTAEVVNSETTNLVSRTKNFQSPDTISLEEAKDYVAAVGVRVEHQNEDHASLFIGTSPNASSVEDLDNALNDKTLSNNDYPVRVLGLDCEMVLTTQGSELARVTLLEFDEFVGPRTKSKTTLLVDCLVRPQNRIVDYLTKHSGITPAMLTPVSTRLEQVQCALKRYLTRNDILVGHSLENDLRALHYIHPRIIDTSMIFRPIDQNKRFKFSLRHLSGTLLKKPIQNGSHCSEEDAQTALDLALLKALRGDDLIVPGFGDDRRQSLLRQQFAKDSVSVFIGPNDWLESHITKHPNGAHALNYDSPIDCKKAMLAWMTNSRKANLIWSNIELGNDTCSFSDSNSSLDMFKSLVTEILAKIPATCVLMVAIQGELQKTIRVFKRRGACRDPRSSVIWSAEDEEQWKKTLESTRVGYVQWFSALSRNKQ